MFSFTAAWNDLIGLQATLRVPMVIRNSSETWGYISRDNPRKLLMRFEEGHAFPTDVDSVGYTLLHVRNLY